MQYEKTARRWATLLTVMTALHCGGPIDAPALDEDLDYVESDDDDDTPERAESYSADAYARAFELIAASAIFSRLVSRVELLPGPDCPEQITPEALVPWRCLRAFKSRHTIISDVDVVEPDDVIRFHRLSDAIRAPERTLDFGCQTNHQPNGHADLHSAGVRKFVLAGWHKPAGGERKYEVLYRRKADGTYRLLPARPKLLTVEWRETKPNRGICIPLE